MSNKLISLIAILIISFALKFFVQRMYKSEGFSNNDTKYLFWTGGYDSTYRLCELTIVERQVVQPIYLLFNIDSKKNTDYWVRKNRTQELSTMKNILKLVHKSFPHTRELIKPPIIIEKDFIDYDFDNKFKKLNLWPKKRNTHQYLFLAKFATQYKKFIDIGVLGIHQNSAFVDFLNKYTYKYNSTYKLSIKPTHPMYYLQFPLFNSTKKALCIKARLNKFDHILAITWSCWFPNDGQNCEKCPMCRERYHC